MKYVLMLLLSISVLIVPASAVGGANEGVDILPFAAVAIPGDYDAVSADGENWVLMDDEVLAEALRDSSVYSTINVGSSEFITSGQLSAVVEEAVIASLLASPAAAEPPSTLDTHPKPPRDEYKLKKTIITSKGLEKEVYKTLVVEKRAGESSKDFDRRSERELRDALDAGWESVP